ncbi:MAG TPA: FHA domain-containing protein [Kofleriaceae bacterium]
MKTVGVDLWGGQVRGAGENRATVLRPVPRPAMVDRELRALFHQAYPQFAPVCRAVDEPGIAMIAVDELTGKATGICTLRARVARYVAAMIGRHDACDLFLRGNDELALRHLAVILDPVKSWARNAASVRYRVLDLRTQHGFRDEHGKPLRGLRAEGPALLRCGGFALFILPLGDPTDWPDNANDAWDAIPERVYFDELQNVPEASMPKMIARDFQNAQTHVSVIMRTQGPRETGDSLVMPGAGVGTLELIGKHHRGTLTLGHAALRDGVLVGRYARCDAAGIIDDPSLSRVHALLIDVEDAFLVIDTASRNGTRLYGQDDARVIAIAGDTELGLGSRTRARWRFTA